MFFEEIFNRFFTDLRKTRENLKVDGEVIGESAKINLVVEFKEDEVNES